MAPATSSFHTPGGSPSGTKLPRAIGEVRALSGPGCGNLFVESGSGLFGSQYSDEDRFLQGRFSNLRSRALSVYGNTRIQPGFEDDGRLSWTYV